MSILKTITVDNFYTKEEANRLTNVVWDLQFEQTEFGKIIKDFNLVPENADELFSKVIKFPVHVIDDQSGIFTFPERFIHFEEFEKVSDWCFAVALQSSTFNLFHHKSGAKTALDEYKFFYRNLFEWDLTVNYLLEPGQGVFFRPWLFHSFDNGLIQKFRLTEKQ